MRTLNVLTVLTVALLLAPAAQANTLTSGDIAVGTNWSEGLPTDPANPGTITSANTEGTKGTITSTVTGLAIQQTGGLLEFTGFGTSTFDGVIYEISGGTFKSTSFGHKSINSSVFDVNGGTLNVVGFGLEGSSTLNLSSGSINATGNLTSKASVFNFSGGTVSVGGDALTSWNNGTLNFSGDAIFGVTGQMGVNFWASSFGVNIGAGDGSISVGTLEADSMSIDWTSGSGFSFTATSILNAGAAATWEDLWNAGNLTVDGGQTGTFADNFNVVDGTLSFVPEPATMSLIALGGLALLRRRRK
jgi:hypothetical protein